VTIPNLAGVATSDLVEKIGGGNFSASYINWSRTLHLLREHAPGWLPELMLAPDGGILHRSPVGGFLLIRFVNVESGAATPPVPQAVMDQRNAAIPFDKISARDVTDTHRRGVCMAAALTFGLAYELWAKLPLESGYAPQDAKPETAKVTPLDGAWDAMSEEAQEFLLKVATGITDHFADPDKPTESEADAAHAYLVAQQLETDEKMALWTRLNSKARTALKKANERANKEKAA
jgi:hypothetical protein